MLLGTWLIGGIFSWVVWYLNDGQPVSILQVLILFILVCQSVPPLRGYFESDMERLTVSDENLVIETAFPFYYFKMEDTGLSHFLNLLFYSRDRLVVMCDSIVFTEEENLSYRISVLDSADPGRVNANELFLTTFATCEKSEINSISQVFASAGLAFHVHQVRDSIE